MSDFFSALAIALFIIAIAWSSDSVVRGAQKTTPDMAMGIRLPALMRSPSAWRIGHAASEPVFRWSAVAASIPALLSVLAWADESLYLAFLLAASAVLVVGPTLACIVAHRAASTVEDDPDG